MFDLGVGQQIHPEHRVDDGFKAQNSATMLVGIGNASEVESLHVRWPSGREQTVRGVTAGTMATLYEDVATAPNGTGFVFERYRRTPVSVEEPSDGVRDRARDWQLRLFPEETSGQVLRLPRPSTLSDESKLVLYLGMATWCKACVGEISEFRDMMRRFESSELSIFGVPCDPKDTEKSLEKWTKRFSPPYRILTGLTEEQRGAMLGVAEATLFRSDALPFSVLTDADGNVLLSTWGLPSVSALKRLLWLQEARVAP